MPIIGTKSFDIAISIVGDPASARLALILPGRLDSKDYQCFKSHQETLAANGFYAVAFDPPGTWESPGGLNLYTTTNYISAVHEFIDHFGRRPTLLLGHSRGGAVATLAGAGHPDVIGLVTIMPSFGTPSPPDPASVHNGFVMEHRDLPPGTAPTSDQKEFLLPLSYFEDGARYDDSKVIRSCTKPKLIFYGTRDKYNSPSDVHEVLRNTPPPTVARDLDSTHDYRYHPLVVDEVNREIGQFINQYFS